MRRVTGIGGVFFKAKDPAALGQWYRTHLGVGVQEWGGAVFRRVDQEGHPEPGTTVWSVNKADTTYFEPSQASFMVNYRVADLAGLLAALRAEGCDVMEKMESRSTGSSAG